MVLLKSMVRQCSGRRTAVTEASVLGLVSACNRGRTCFVAPQWVSRRQIGANLRPVPSIQVKDVPEEVHAVLRRRAAQAGQSLQEYLLARLRLEAETETVDEVLARIAHRSGGRVTFARAVRTVRAERDAR